MTRLRWIKGVVFDPVPAIQYRVWETVVVGGVVVEDEPRHSPETVALLREKWNSPELEDQFYPEREE